MQGKIRNDEVPGVQGQHNPEEAQDKRMAILFWLLLVLAVVVIFLMGINTAI